jgi:hypothetical protein
MRASHLAHEDTHVDPAQAERPHADWFSKGEGTMAVIFKSKDGRELARFAGRSLIGADLRSLCLRGANLVGHSLAGADLRDVDLGFSDIRGCNLQFARLEGACLEGADCRGASFIAAKLQSTNFLGANIVDARFEGCERDDQTELYGAWHDPEAVESMNKALPAATITVPVQSKRPMPKLLLAGPPRRPAPEFDFARRQFLEDCWL